MLKHIPKIISPELMKALMQMGHSDVIILADANFPAESNAKRLIRADGCELPELMDTILHFMPLDNFADHPVKLMQPLPSEPRPQIWDEYTQIIAKQDQSNAFCEFELMERMAFYEYARTAFVIVSTGTQARYANVALQKGVV